MSREKIVVRHSISRRLLESASRKMGPPARMLPEHAGPICVDLFHPSEGPSGDLACAGSHRLLVRARGDPGRQCQPRLRHPRAGPAHVVAVGGIRRATHRYALDGRFSQPHPHQFVDVDPGDRLRDASVRGGGERRHGAGANPAESGRRLRRRVLRRQVRCRLPLGCRVWRERRREGWNGRGLHELVDARTERTGRTGQGRCDRGWEPRSRRRNRDLRCGGSFRPV